MNIKLAKVPQSTLFLVVKENADVDLPGMFLNCLLALALSY